MRLSTLIHGKAIESPAVDVASLVTVAVERRSTGCDARPSRTVNVAALKVCFENDGASVDRTLRVIELY